MKKVAAFLMALALAGCVQAEQENTVLDALAPRLEMDNIHKIIVTVDIYLEDGSKVGELTQEYTIQSGESAERIWMIEPVIRQ